MSDYGSIQRAAQQTDGKVACFEGIDDDLLQLQRRRNGAVFNEINRNLPQAIRPPNNSLNSTWTSTSTLDNETIYLVVSGKKFCISKSALLTFPRTKLGQLASRHRDGDGKLEYVFDRNSKIMAAVLDLYRTGELHLPANLCSLSIRRELQYWGIPDELISECCFGRYVESMRHMTIVDELDKVMVTTRGADDHERDKWKEYVWQTMERPGISLASWAWLGIYMGFLALSIIVVCLSTMRRFRVEKENEDGNSDHDTILDNLMNSDLTTPMLVLDTVGLVFFTVEPFVRLIVTPDQKIHLAQFLTILDFFLITDHWTVFLMEQASDLLRRNETARYVHVILRSLLSLRVLRIFHLARRFVKMKALLLTLRASIAEILLLFLGVSIAVIVFATSIYYVEILENQNNFQNIPQSIWWAIITMTTVGYGDYYPVSVAGYFVGTLCALSGLLLLSMPIAIIANNFNTYTHGLGARDQRERRLEVLRELINKKLAYETWDSSRAVNQNDDAHLMTYSTSKIKMDDMGATTDIDLEGSDYATTQRRSPYFYINGLRSKTNSSDFIIARRQKHRRMSDGVVLLRRKCRHEKRFSNNLTSSVSEGVLPSSRLGGDNSSSHEDTHHPSQRDPTDVLRLNSDKITKALEKSNLRLHRHGTPSGTPTELWSDKSKSKSKSNLPVMNVPPSGAGGGITDPREKRKRYFKTSKPQKAVSDHRDSITPNPDSSPVIDDRTGKTRIRKHRPRRKTWGSLSRLNPPGKEHTSTRGKAKLKTDQNPNVTPNP